MAAFSHALGLSISFHANKNAAEIARAIEQGDRLMDTIETAVLDIAPTVIDIGVAFSVLSAKYSLSVSVYMVVASVVFVVLEAVSSSWNLARRRTVAELGRDEKNTVFQALQGWPTVSVFNMFIHERRRLANATCTHLQARAEWARRSVVNNINNTYIANMDPLTILLYCQRRILYYAIWHWSILYRIAKNPTYWQYDNISRILHVTVKDITQLP
jgi:ABC-type transport system involved in Fe-S cluster assembly fused permease/ATPase subunit